MDDCTIVVLKLGNLLVSVELAYLIIKSKVSRLFRFREFSLLLILYRNPFGTFDRESLSFSFRDTKLLRFKMIPKN